MSAKFPKFEVFKSAGYGLGGRHEWYWRLRAKNSQIIAISGEGYTRKADAERSVYRLCDTLGAHDEFIVKLP